ncbi:MAG: ATP-binding protein [Bacteroidales bacterium]|nr:ATP-binding protein [Bacteroidales bacterium]
MKYPIGIQNFPNLIRDGYEYVDKTSFIYKLTHTFQACFLSRPRRFGKSLLLSTMEAYFKGDRELFKSLAIEDLEKDWIKYPVIHLDLNNGDFRSAEKLEAFINRQLRNLEKKFGLEPSDGELGDRFEDIITNLYDREGQRIVVLIDEYDKPLQQVITDKDAQADYREVLRPFYGTLKKTEACLKFIFITGVTKFAKLSVFSDLNQLKDISLLPEYDTICGLTRDELEMHFHEGVENFANAKGWSYDQMIRELVRKYNGYHFSERLVGILNPFSVFNSLSDKKLSDYWFQTGTPSFLVKELQNCHTDLNTLDGYRAEASLLASVASTVHTPVPLLYQSGYLTIKRYEKESETYILGYPNEEVEQAFLRFLLPNYTQMRGSNSKYEIDQLVSDFRNGEVKAVLERIQSFLSGFNYELILDCEAHYQNVLYIIFKLISLQTEVEKRISNGRIDMVVKTHHYVYVMEFKYKGTAKAALKQIKDKGYALPYMTDPRTIFLVGVNFSTKTRNIDSRWQIEELRKV